MLDGVLVQNNPVNFIDPMGLFPWHEDWGGPGRTAGQDKPESELTITDIQNVGAVDARDNAYRNHDINVWSDRHDYVDDLVLAKDLLKIMPWDPNFWGTSKGYPVPSLIESVGWATGIPGLLAPLFGNNKKDGSCEK